ncbi:GNAT family N-acetyltransferase [uncultured Clostridium sp.]|uniref:GNAT family N-acetyltransferase n=1 Tax=uncultured Clostridium sp. TaxID=59620 RepID=UPI0028EC0427|nr:GNAT family N-acetyltransferase [uncultured Clostridium sp.]
MDKFIIREINEDEKIPFDLLLLADPSMEAIKDYISRGECYGGYIEDIIVGVYVLIKTRPFTMELVNVAIKEEFQGKGLGKRIVMDAIHRSREKKAKTLEVGTGNSSISQLALYQKCGFRMKSIDKNFFIKHYEDKIIENGIDCVDMIRLSLDL